MASFNQARSILEKIARRHPLVAADQSRLANCYAEIGILAGLLESGDHGLNMLEKATGNPATVDRQRAAAISPTRQRLAEIINALGFVYFKRTDFPAAFRCFQQVQEICMSLMSEITDGPTPVKLLSLLSLSHYNMATMHVIDKQTEKALQSFEKSLEYRRALVELASVGERVPGEPRQ